MNVNVINNRGGTALELGITAEDDDGAFLALDLRDFESGDEVIELLITDPADVDSLEQAVTAAVADFRRRTEAKQPEPAGPKAKRG